MRLFISYSFQDYPNVQRIGREFAEKGYSVWIAQDSIKNGPWPPQIATAIRECDLFILALTARSRDSLMVQNEILEAHKRGRPMMILRLETGIDFGEWGPVLNVWQHFDWVDSQIPRILQEIAANSRPVDPLPSVPPAAAAPAPRRGKHRKLWAAICLTLGILGLIPFLFQFERFRPHPTDPAARQELLLFILPGPEQSTPNPQTARFCTVLRPLVSFALEPTARLTFRPNDDAPESLAKFAQDAGFSKDSLFAGLEPVLRSAPCIALYPEFLPDDADDKQTKLYISLKIREPQGNFKTSLKWVEFFSQNPQRFRGPSSNPQWLAARASVELARFLVTEGVVPVAEKKRAGFTENLTVLLWEASLRNSQIRGSLPSKLLSDARNQSPQARLELLIREIDAKTEPSPAITAVEKARLEVKRNLTPFSQL